MSKRILTQILAGGVYVLALVIGCGPSLPQPIEWGKDTCAHCRMSLVDDRFGTELVTQKGRLYFFDDLLCLVEFVRNGSLSREEIKEVYVCDYAQPNTLVPSNQAVFLYSTELRSPMRGDVAAFGSEERQREAQQTHGGEPMSWADIWNEIGG